MPALIYTSEELIETVRNRARLPNVSITGITDDDILRVLNEQMKAFLVPGIMKPQEEHLLRTYRMTLGTSGVYRIPPRASGLKLHTLFHIDENGNRGTIPQMQWKDVPKNTDDSATTPIGVIMEGAWMRLLPMDSTCFTGSLEMTFFLRPGDLVLEDEYRVIQTVDSTTQVTLTEAAPATWTGTYTYDVHSPSSGGDVKVWSRPCTIEDATVTFSTAVDGSVYGDYPVESGDYFTIQSTAAVPALPVELHIPLALTTAASITAPINPDLSTRLDEEFQRMMAAAGYLIGKRLESPPRSLSVKNPAYGDR